MANTITPAQDSAQGYTIVVDADTSFTLDRNDCPALVHNASASGTVVVTLPQDAKAGDTVRGYVTVAQALRFDPGAAGAIYCSNGTSKAKQTDDKYVQGSAIGESIKLVSLGNGDWVAEQGTVAGSTDFDAVEA